MLLSRPKERKLSSSSNNTLFLFSSTKDFSFITHEYFTKSRRKEDSWTRANFSFCYWSLMLMNLWIKLYLRPNLEGKLFFFILPFFVALKRECCENMIRIWCWTLFYCYQNEFMAISCFKLCNFRLRKHLVFQDFQWSKQNLCCYARFDFR